MLDLVNFPLRRQKRIQMAFPARGILALPIPFHLGPIEDRLDPAAQTARGLCLRRPDRSQRLQYMIRRDSSDPQLSDRRIRILLDCLRPLVGMLLVLPTGAVVVDVGLCANLERVLLSFSSANCSAR